MTTTLPAHGGGAQPARIDSSGKVTGGAAMRVYGFASEAEAQAAGYVCEGGPAMSVALITDAQLASGEWKLDGDPFAVVIYTAPDNIPSEGGFAVPVYPVNGWGSAPAPVIGDDFMQTTVNLTDAQIKALPTTAVEIIAAPGTNKLIVPFTILLHLKNWVADYANIDNSSFIRVDISGSFITPGRQDTYYGVTDLLAGGGPDGTWETMTINSLAAIAFTTATPAIDPHYHQGAADSGWYDSDIVNKPLKISIENGSGDLTGGNAAQSLDVIVFYNIIDTV